MTKLKEKFKPGVTKYLLHYVEDCTPKIKLFKSLSAAKKCVNSLQKDKENHTDFIVEISDLVILDKHYSEFVED